MWIPKVRRFPLPDPRAARSPVGRAPLVVSAAAALALIALLGLARTPTALGVAALFVLFWCILSRYSPLRPWRVFLFFTLFALLPVLLYTSRELVELTLENLARTFLAMLVLAALWNALPPERRLRGPLHRLERETVRLQERLAAALRAHAFRSGGKRAGPLFWLARLPDLVALLYFHSRLAPRETEGKPTSRHPG